MSLRPILLYGKLLLCGGPLLTLASCEPAEAEYVIGVSQCSQDEWRTQMNREIQREALFFPGVEVKITSANDDSRKQIQDIDSLLKQGVDLLVVAPNEAESITPIIEKAYRSGTPVVLVDRKTHSSRYTAYIGADNREIGRGIGSCRFHSGHGTASGDDGGTGQQSRHRGVGDGQRRMA